MADWQSVESWHEPEEDRPSSAGRPDAPAWWPSERRRSARIGVRMLSLVVGSLIGLLTVQWALFDGITASTVVDSHLAEYRALAGALEVRGPSSQRQVLTLTAANPRVLLAAVLDEEEPRAEHADGDLTLLHEESVLAFIAADRAVAPVELPDRLGYAFRVPLDDGRRLLVVEVDIVSVVAHSIRGGMNWVSGMTVLLVLPLGWFLGGRRLVAAARHLEEQVSRDGLTDLPNHRAFLGALPSAIELAAQAGAPLTLCLLDLDRFGSFDDAVGHVAADQVLVSVARAVEERCPPRGAFRVGGDQFALILPLEPTAAVGVAEELRASLELHFPITASIGVAWPDEAVRDDADLQLAATAAVAHAKRSGRNRVRSYREIEHSSLLPTPRRRAALRELIEAGTIDVVWQPIVRCDGSVQGYEALSRPRSSDRDLQSPAAAFALADISGATVELDAACRRAILDGASAIGDAWLFLNVSPLSLVSGALDPDRFVADLVVAGLSPGQVVVELTEREIVEPALLDGPVRALRAAGVRVALDDVGAGNAGLGVLQTMPIDVIKLDRSLVADAAVGRVRAAAVVIAIHTLARDLGLELVAEGVETIDEIDLGTRIGTLLQGFGIARPAATPQEAAAAVISPADR